MSKLGNLTLFSIEKMLMSINRLQKEEIQTAMKRKEALYCGVGWQIDQIVYTRRHQDSYSKTRRTAGIEMEQQGRSQTH
jgi:hypothetical protein